MAKKKPKRAKLFGRRGGPLDPHQSHPFLDAFASWLTPIIIEIIKSKIPGLPTLPVRVQK